MTTFRTIVEHLLKSIHRCAKVSFDTTKMPFSTIAFNSQLATSNFQLSTRNSQLATFLFLSAFTLSSCRFNPSVQGRGSDFLQGEWRQDSVSSEHKLVNYSLYNFRFTCDSFFVKLKTYSKVNYGADTCMNKGKWTEYMKGHYDQRNDTLHLRGFFCNPDYSLKNEGGCFRFGVYEDEFKVVAHQDSSVVLFPLSSTLPINLKLIKRLGCIPKPL